MGQHQRDGDHMSVDLEHERFNVNPITLWEHERVTLGPIPTPRPDQNQLERLRQQVDAERIARYQAARQQRKTVTYQRWVRAMETKGHRIHGGLQRSQENT